MIHAALALMLVTMPLADGREAFDEKIPGTLVSFRMVPLPDGEITVRGQRAEVNGLMIGATEVTWDLYDIWAFRRDQTDDEVARGVDAQSRPSRPYGAPDKGFGHRGFAALGVTYLAAEEFCRWLSAKTGKRYRLPTEAEWEYAARAGATSDPTDLEAVAWFWDNSEDVAHAVGTKRPNAWGVYDALGNMAEWATGMDGRPVACGGSWRDKRDAVGFSARQHQTPKWNENDPQNPKSRWWLSNAPFIGFRVVLEP